MAEVTRKGFKDKNGNKVSLIAQVINAITGHFAGLNNKGEVVDSGYGPNDFAESDHIHNSIETEHVALGEANVEVDVDGTNGGEVTISVRKGNGPLKFAVIKDSNIANLIRALLDPDSTPTDGSDNLITSQAVYEALNGIVTLSHQHAISDVINLETALAGKLPYINLGLTIENHPDDSTRYPITSAIGTQLDALVSALSSNTPTPCIVTLYTTRQVSFTDPQTNEPSTTTMVTTQKAVAFITVDKTVPSSPAVYIDFPNGYRFTAIKTGNFMDGYSWPDGFLKTPDVFFATLS